MSNVTDNLGVHAATYNYKAFGIICSQSGSISSQWSFTGRQYDAESGFYYYRNRCYDPRAGRFITQDPIGTAGGVNLYAYCSNDPVNFVDPWGLCASGDPIIDDPAVWAEMNKAWGESFKPNAQDPEMHEQGGWIFEDNNGRSVSRWPQGTEKTINIPDTRPNGTVGEFHTHPLTAVGRGKFEPSSYDYISGRIGGTYGLNHYIVDSQGIMKYSPSPDPYDPGTGSFEYISIRATYSFNHNRNNEKIKKNRR